MIIVNIVNAKFQQNQKEERYYDVSIYDTQ